MWQNWIEEVSASVWYISINRGSDSGLTCLMCNVKKENSPFDRFVCLLSSGQTDITSASQICELAEWFWTPCGTGQKEDTFSETLPSSYATRPFLIWLSFTLKIIHFSKSDKFYVTLSEVIIQPVSGMPLTCLCHTVADMVGHWKANLQPNWQNRSFVIAFHKQNYISFFWSGFLIFCQCLPKQHIWPLQKSFIWVFSELPPLCLMFG